MSTTQPIEVDALIARLWEKLDTLPQRDLIEMSDAKQWIDYMARIMPREAVWHMIRAGGVGGSEIGGLVRNYMGKMADHEFSAMKWAEGKLLRRVPDLPKGVTERGHFMEPLIAERLYEELGAVRDQAAFDALSKAQGKRIWMRYSPDDIVILDKPTMIMTADGPIELQGRILVDYKAPTVVDHSSSISFQYGCQLHQGALLCQEQGIELDGTLLTQFDWASFSLKNDVVDINPELCELIPVVGDHYWDYVMRGEIPAPIVRKRAQIDPKTFADWQEAATRLAQINAMRTKLENESDALRDKLVNGLGLNESRLDGQALKFPGALSITASNKIDEPKVREALGEEVVTSVLVKETTTKYDEKLLVKALKAQGVDVKPFRKLTRMDPTLVFDALVDKGLDPDEFMKESPRIGVDPGMKEQAADWFAASFPELELPALDQPQEEAQPAATPERPRGG